MRGYRTEITRAEFDNACRLYTTRPTTGTGSTGTGSTGGTGSPTTIGIKDINTPIFNDGVIEIDPTKTIKQFR